MKKTRVVINLHGGTVEAIFTDSETPLDVVFTESPKYCEGEDEDEVERGPNRGECIYTRGESLPAPDGALDAAFEAADRYSFPKSEWKTEVSNGDTSLGYAEWLQHKIESNS